MNHDSIVMQAMIDYLAGDIKRINHLAKVYAFARVIGQLEGLDHLTQEILEIAALTHDIGIKNCEIKYGHCGGDVQQIEGPPEAAQMLEKLGFAPSAVDRVCWLIAHHHTYHPIEGIDHQILIEADFMVNAAEDQLPQNAIRTARRQIFRTTAGCLFLDSIYQIKSQQG